jgi:hypothetical protein
MYSISPDTNIDAAIQQFEILHRMTIEQRAEKTFELMNNLRGIVESGIRDRHPDYDDEKVKLAILQMTLGESLFQKIFGDIDIKR